MLKQLIRLGAIEVVFLALGLLSAGFRTVINDRYLTWRSLGAPPGKAMRIIDGDDLAVRVQAVPGDTYFCRFNALDECWIHNDLPAYSQSTSDSPRLGMSYREPPPLSDVVDTRRFYTELSEYTVALSVYAVTNKGEVYVWQDGLGDPFEALVYMYEAIPVAVLGGLVFWWFLAQWPTVRQRMRHAVPKGKGA